MARINAVSFHEDPSIESICRKIRDAGFDSVEISRTPFFGKLTTRHTRLRFVEWAAGLGLSLYGFDCWVEVQPFQALPETLAGFRAAIDFARDLGLGMIISHDPWIKDQGGRGPSECLRVSIDLFRRVADMCAAEELDLTLEPHPDTLSMNNDWCIDLIDGLQRPNVGVVYDCCHYGVGQPKTYMDAIGTLGGRLRHVHYSDGDRRTYALHLPLGDGDLDLPGIVSALRQIPFRGTLTNDMYNYPLLQDGAHRNVQAVRQVEKELGIA